MTASHWVHPRFDRPPVVETAFSIEFTPLERWQVPFFGLYWGKIRDRYPKQNVLASLPSQIEQLEDSTPLKRSLVFDVRLVPPLRCWFFNEDESQLIQIQNDRFIFNWKRGLTNESYPNYDNICPIILQEWHRFIGFVAENQLGDIHVQQCDLTYINHVVKGEGWKSYEELGEVLPVWCGRRRNQFLPEPEDVEVRVRYLMPEKRGRLYIHAQPAIRNIDLKEIIQLTLTARGRPSSSDPTKVFDWFDIAQEWTAKGFLDFTSEKMHSFWGKKGDP